MINNHLNAQDRAEIVQLTKLAISKISRLEGECKEIHLSIEELYVETES